MWKVVVFPDDEVAAVPLLWLIIIKDKLMCFWPKKDARTKRAKNVDPSSVNDKYKLHECRELMNGEIFADFKEALAKEILAQDFSYIVPEIDDVEDGASCPKKQKLSDNEEEFEFIKDKKEIHIIDDVHINQVPSVLAANEFEACRSNPVSPKTEVFLLRNQSSHLENTIVEHKNQEKVVLLEVPLEVATDGLHALDEVEVIESLSDSEKLKKILLNQMAEKKVYSELVARMDRVEKHIKKYGGSASFSKVIEDLPLQVTSPEMFSELEKELLDATITAVVKYFNKTIFEKDIKQYVKILLNRFFEAEFFAYNVTGKAGGKIVLNRTKTLRCIFDCIEKKFNKKRKDVEDAVFKAIDQLKDSLRKKFPRPKKNREQNLNVSEEVKLTNIRTEAGSPTFN